MIQFDYPSGGISRKERKKYTFSNFRGVDTSVAKINVDPSRAVESTNFVDRNGALHKRYGWEQMYQFDGEINGFWELYLHDVKHTICYAGTTFYLLDKDEGWKYLYTAKNLVSRRTSCYVQNNKAYFIGCGDFLVFRQISDVLAFFPVFDDLQTFIPTTTAQISSQSSMEAGIGKQYVRDPVNLLTGWRKNTLVREDIPEGGFLKYQLDATPDFDKKKEVRIDISGKQFYFSNGIVGTETIHKPEVDESVKGLWLKVNPHNLSVDDHTELVNPAETENYPDIEYDAISTENSYSSWILEAGRRIITLGGLNPIISQIPIVLQWGLVWRRGEDYVQDEISYRVYDLCLVNHDRTSSISCLRRVYRNPYWMEIATDEVWGTTAQFADENGFDEDRGNCDVSLDIHIKNTHENEVKVIVEVSVKTGVLSLNTFPPTANWTTHTKKAEIIISAGKKASDATWVLFGDIEYDNEWWGGDPLKELSYKIKSVQEYQEESIVNAADVYGMDTEGQSTPVEDFLGSSQESDFVINEIGNQNYQQILSFVSYDEGHVCNDETTGFHCIMSKRTLTVKNWGEVAEENDSTVTVTFYVRDNANKSNLITKSKYSTLYGVNGESDRLFVTNSNDRTANNLIFFSELSDFTYFPDNFTKVVGGNANEVKGFLRLANGSMAALKNFIQNEPTVFVFSGDYIDGYYDSEKTEPYTLPRFSTSGVSATQGIIAPYASFNLADDSLFLSQNGVYALELSQGTDSQRFAKERSLPINKLLRECNMADLEEAVGITHDNKYYLAVKHYKKTTDKERLYLKSYYVRKNGQYQPATSDVEMHELYEQEDCVYVADAHYSFTPAGAMADAPSYEWYPLTNVPVYNWFILGEELYFGTKDGRICKFIEGSYADIQKQYFAENVDSAAVKAFCQSTPKTITSFFDSADEDVYIDTFAISETSMVEDGNTLVFISGTIKGFPYGLDETENIEVDLLNTEFIICKETDGIQLKMPGSDTVVQFSGILNPVAEIRKKTVVTAHREMATFDFGMPDYLKTLEEFTVVMNGTEGGEASLTIAARNHLDKFDSVRGQKAFNLQKGIKDMSYDVSFQNSYTKRVAIRNFNYLSLSVDNVTETDCSVASVSLIYKYNANSRGVK